MKSIYQKAKDYSSKKFELAMSKAIAQAYLDGFKDGYKARKDKEESGFIDDIDFVDLGLPSGTLWASDSLRDDEELCLLTFDEANMLDIPSEEQWEELVDHCSCRFVNNANGTIGVDFVGPNDQTIHFSFSSNRFIARIIVPLIGKRFRFSSTMTCSASGYARLKYASYAGSLE